MDRRIKELIDFTETKLGLENYYLESHKLYRHVNIFNETIYTLSMEWFPNHVTELEDDNTNPEGTAVIDIDVNSRKLESVIFVGGTSYANGITCCEFDRNDIIKWIEQETELTYEKQFQLHKEEKREFQFKECIDGVAVSSSGSIEIRFDQEGKLTKFSVHGQFPPKEIVKEEAYTLSLEMVDQVAKNQLQLIEFPSYEKKRLFPVYVMEEIYITNDQTSIIPYEFIADVRSYLELGETINWDEPINKPFERIEIDWMEDVTAEQAFSSEPSPDSFPILKEEQEKCLVAVKDFLRQEYPNDSGNWNLKTLHREKGYIHAILRANIQDDRVFQRKLSIIIDAHSLQVLNYIDNQLMLKIFDQFEATDEVTVTKEEAYEKLKELFELTPYYVYDFDQKQYVLCGKLDCPYGVNASSGEVIDIR